jgi:choline dehydrogenase-like flavoprotein
MKPLDYSAVEYLGHAVHTAKTHSRGPGGHLELDADVVIAGSGPGGLTTAVILAEAGLDVVILEAGQFWTHESFERNMNWAQNHLYQAKGTRVMRGNAFIPLASGRGVGGGTLVNSAICFRTPDYVLDEWVEGFGVEHWQKANREVMYAEVEAAIGVVKTGKSIAGENSHVAHRGFSAMPGVEHDYMPRNAKGCVGCGTCHTGCPTGGKASADLNWLPRALRAGAEVYADTRVEEVVVRSGRATGVRGRMRDPETDEVVAHVEVRADRVLMACGSIFSPLLLLKQDLGTSSGELGHNLRVHPGIAVGAKMPHEVEIWNGATQGYYAHHPEDPEVLAETFSAGPDALFTQTAQMGAAGTEFLRHFKYIAGCGTMIRDSTAGQVKIGPGGNADISYFLNRDDVDKFKKGMIFVAEMFYEADAESVFPLVNGARWYRTLHHLTDDVNALSRPGSLSLYASHPMGTARMHADPRQGVVRPSDGKVHDVDGLHVVDASVLPTGLGVNPQLTIMANSIAMARQIVAS